MFEELGVLYRGLIMGLMVAAPVGPVGLLCIRRTVHRGLLVGFASGFGAAFADAFFSAIAAFGVTAITEWVRAYHLTIYLLGGVFMLIVAYHTWHDKPRQPQAEDAVSSSGPEWGRVIKAMASSFVITLTNPMTLFAVLAAVATFSGVNNRIEATTFVTGVFAGSSLWWLMLSGGIALVSRRFSENSVMMINHITAVVLGVIGLWALGAGAAGYLGFAAAPQ